MKRVLIFSAILASANAMAAPVPTTLPDGKYQMECQSIMVQKFDADPSGPTSSEQTASDGINRRVQFQTGTSLYVTSGDTTTVKEVYTLKGPHFSGTGEDYTQKTIKKVDDKFEETATTTTSFKTDGADDKVSPETYTYSRTFTVHGDFEINLTAKNGDKPETPARGESVVTKNRDGSYTVVTYLREGYHRDREEKDGIVRAGTQILQSNSTCRYTPVPEPLYMLVPRGLF